MKRIDWFVARRYLSSTRKGRFGSFSTIISVLGITVGVMALLLVVAVMTGLQRDLQAKILGSSPHIYMWEPSAYDFRLGDWEKALETVRATPGVVAAEPFVQVYVMIAKVGNPRYAQPGELNGLDPLISKVPLSELEKQVREGTVQWEKPKSGLPGVMVGVRLAERLGLMAGDTIMLASAVNMDINSLTTMPQPRVRPFEVTGTFETGMYEYDNTKLYSSITDAQEYIGMPSDTVSGLNINVSDPWHVDPVAAALDARFDHRNKLTTWLDLNAPLFGALKLEKLAMAVILGLIIIVASFNIMSTLMMLVTEKTREIGIMKSMGMTDGSVMRIFMTQGLIIGIVGTAAGLILGLTAMWVVTRFELIRLPAEVYFIDHLPLYLDWFDGAMIVVASLLIAFLSTISPAHKASKLVPVDAIRHD